MDVDKFCNFLIYRNDELKFTEKCIFPKNSLLILVTFSISEGHFAVEC